MNTWLANSLKESLSNYYSSRRQIVGLLKYIHDPKKIFKSKKNIWFHERRDSIWKKKNVFFSIQSSLDFQVENPAGGWIARDSARPHC